MMVVALSAPTRRILNMREAAAYLSMSVTTSRECVAPKVPGIKLMHKRMSYDVEELNTFINRMAGKVTALTEPTEKSFWDKYK